MRNLYPGTCYKCGCDIPVGFGFFQRAGKYPSGKIRWKLQCVKCCDGRKVRETDKEVQKAILSRNTMEFIDALPRLSTIFIIRKGKIEEHHDFVADSQRLYVTVNEKSQIRYENCFATKQSAETELLRRKSLVKK